MPEIVEGIVRRRKFVYLCTNGLLLKPNISKYKPSPYLTFSIHLDGNRQRHDASVSRQGIYDVAVEAIQLARAGGFRVNINCTLYGDVTAEEMAGFFDFVTGLGIEGITVAPGFNYEHAPKQDVFLKQNESKQFFRDLFKLGKGRGWKFNHTGLYLDFLAGNENYQCTPWGNPTRNVFGWQQPCYLLMDEGYVPSFRALMEETEWDKYGVGRHPKCGHCMLHSGFEATAVNDMLAHPMKALRVFLRGADTDGPMAAEPPNPDKPEKVPKMSKVN
jgi:hopanoid biosynthesis associated radical SAM protein HpnH